MNKKTGNRKWVQFGTGTGRKRNIKKITCLHRPVTGKAKDCHMHVLYRRNENRRNCKGIAKALHIPKGTVNSRLHLAKKQLKICLEADGYEV